ncbi:MAG: hypothetical protein EPO08_01235 [Rhodospirillaceae bacterium]|nr:MAG: hypothetical protein EPO08_01235 [Rhodospirillaceae bacterium]
MTMIGGEDDDTPDGDRQTGSGYDWNEDDAGAPEYQVSDASTTQPAHSDSNPLLRICTVDAHGVVNNLPTRDPTRPGAYKVPETPGTGVIDREQFLPPGANSWSAPQRNAYLNQYRNQISGYVPNGQGGYTQVFNGVSDNIGGLANRTKLENTYPGRVLFELPGGQNYEEVPGMQFRLPWAMGCPRP